MGNIESCKSRVELKEPKMVSTTGVLLEAVLRNKEDLEMRIEGSSHNRILEIFVNMDHEMMQSSLFV